MYHPLAPSSEGLSPPTTSTLGVAFSKNGPFLLTITCTMEELFTYFQAVWISVLLLLIFPTICCIRRVRSRTTKSDTLEECLPLMENINPESSEVGVSSEDGCTKQREQDLDDQKSRQQVDTKGIVDLGGISDQEDSTVCKKWDQPCDQFTTDDIKKVIDIVWEARIKWYDIGIQLGLKVNSLDVIKHNNNDKPDDCITEMLKIWLRQGGATHEALIGALNHETVGFSSFDLANSDFNLSAMYVTTDEDETTSSKNGFQCPLCGSCSIEQYLKRKCPKLHLASESAFLYLETENLTENEMEKFQMKLIKETEDIDEEFFDLVYDLRRSFEGRINPITLATTVLTCDSDSLDSLDIKETDAVFGLLLQKHCLSFFNYHIIQRLVKNHGSDKDKRKLHTYEESLKKFCQRSVFEVPQNVFGRVLSNGVKVAFKVTNEMAAKLQTPTRKLGHDNSCLLYTSPSPRDATLSRMPSSA